LGKGSSYQMKEKVKRIISSAILKEGELQETLVS